MLAQPSDGGRLIDNALSSVAQGHAHFAGTCGTFFTKNPRVHDEG
jgi:hypothetical protein